MKYVNLSLISKLGWKLLSSHNSLWVSLFQQKYIRYGNFLSSSLTFGSWIWNGIKATLPIISAKTCFIPHNNSSLPIWSSPWIPIVPFFTPIARLPSIPSNHPLAISDLIHSPTMSCRPGGKISCISCSIPPLSLKFEKSIFVPTLIPFSEPHPSLMFSQPNLPITLLTLSPLPHLHLSPNLVGKHSRCSS
jgi:hypothetical protein